MEELRQMNFPQFKQDSLSVLIERHTRNNGKKLSQISPPKGRFDKESASQRRLNKILGTSLEDPGSVG